MADNRRYVYNRLIRELGLTPAQAAGAVGGLGGESGRTLNPNAVNPTSGALGIGQWLGGRMRGVRKGDVRQQTSHLIAELKGPERAALNQLRSAKSIAEATRVFVEHFERPSAGEIASSMPARLNYAREAFNAFGTGGGGSGGSAGGRTLGKRGSSGGGRTTVRTITETTPGVDNRMGRYQAVQDFLGTKKADPLDFALQIRDLQDVAPTSTTRTLRSRTPGSSPSARGGGSGARPANFGAGGGRRGSVVFAPGADRPGVSTQQITKNFLAHSAGLAGRSVDVGTGTNHNRMTTSGNVSDHWSGHAADLPMPVDSQRGDLMAAHALQAAGVPWSKALAMAQKGGVFNVTPTSGPFKGHRVQVLWKTYVGGNHHNHVHVGIR